MRNGVLGAVTAVVTTVGVVGTLAGCSGEPVADAPPASASDHATPTAQSTQTSRPTPSEADPISPAVADRAPLGLEIRYVDENGSFVTVSPEDFPR